MRAEEDRGFSEKGYGVVRAEEAIHPRQEAIRLLMMQVARLFACHLGTFAPSGTLHPGPRCTLQLYRHGLTTTSLASFHNISVNYTTTAIPTS